MNRYSSLLFIVLLCSCIGKANKAETSFVPDDKTFECDYFSISYPKEFYSRVDSSKVGYIQFDIAIDSLFSDFMTSVYCLSQDLFPGSTSDFVTLFAYQEIQDYEKSNTFYDIINEDSTYTIDGYPTYSLVSIFSEGTDTIMQSRTGLIIPNKLNLMVVQKMNTKRPVDDASIMTYIINSIKLKK